MDQIILQFGYVGLFAVSFLAATILPMGSEAAVGLLILAGLNSYAVFAVATAGNCLGALCNYGMGRWGGPYLMQGLLKLPAEKQQVAVKRFNRWGTPVLFFAWVPGIGDPLTVVAGVLKANPYTFCFWVFSGKALRYWLLIAGVTIWA